jgi:hypothetical protein
VAEDRNALASGVGALPTGTWRPSFGMAEDRNVNPVTRSTVKLMGVGGRRWRRRRIATTRAASVPSRRASARRPPSAAAEDRNEFTKAYGVIAGAN